MAMFFAMVVLTVSSLYVGPSARDASVWGVLGEMLGGVPLLAFPVVGALIALKRPENPIGWICLIVGLFWMLFGLEEGIGAYASARFGQVRPSLTIEALNQGIWALPVGLLGIYMILLFPDGKLPSRRWRPLAWFSGGADSPDLRHVPALSRSAGGAPRGIATRSGRSGCLRLWTCGSSSYCCSPCVSWHRR